MAEKTVIAESLDDIFGFLGTKVEALPEGIEFSNSGFIGQVIAKKTWKFWSGEDIKFYTDQLPYKEGVDYVVSTIRDDSHFYYFFDEEAGKAAAKVLKRYNPDHTWRFEMPTSSVKSFRTDTAAEKWGQSISADTQIAPLGSRKHRHEYHMLTLPSLIDAFARRAGMLTESIWHCQEMLDASIENLTDEFEWRMVGHPDANDQDKERMAELLVVVNNDLAKAHAVALGHNVSDNNLKDYEGVKIHYTYSHLWQRRAQLWKALGEDNAAAYIVAGTSTTEKGKEFETSATTKLNVLLKVSTIEWAQPIWVQMYTVYDPTVGSAYSSKGSMTRPKLPVIGEIFKDEAAAIAATGNDSTVTVAVQTSNLPPYPAAWVGSEADFRQMLADVKAGPNKPMVLVAKDFACTVEEIQAWWEHV